MSAWLKPTRLAVLCAAIGVAQTMAATSSRVDVLPRGNPLWSVPLAALTATQERPIFSATRRPPPRAAAAAPVVEVRTPPPTKPVEPPPLILVGAVVGEGDAIAILVNRTDQKVLRMRPGETLGGWSLTSVQPREVTFKQGERSEVLALQRPGGTNAPVGLPAPADGGGKLTMPTTASTTSFAPFVPRSTPKNGESDGL